MQHPWLRLLVTHLALWVASPAAAEPILARAPAGAVPVRSGSGATTSTATGYYPDWTSLSPNFYPLGPAAVAQPVISAASVTDAQAAFVADPFLIHDDGKWNLFFEVTTPVGRIALATSTDGLHWKYRHIVLSESFQLSFPYVFRYDGVYYMTPESSARNSVRLYRAIDFPDSWEYVTDLVKGRSYADPSVFRYDDRWWMFVGNGRSDSCFVFYSDSLTTGWTPHPLSPIVAGNRGRARPGGRAVVLGENRLYRLAQNDTPTYGRALRAFQVDQMTLTTYVEHEIPESPIVQGDGTGWNADGMHTCDPWWIGDRWLAAVDGDSAGVWRIGIYTTPTISGIGPEPAADAIRPRLRCAPNPFRTSTEVRCEFPAALSMTGGRITIYDPTGALVVSRLVPMSLAGVRTLTWDGTDARGGRVPAGVYFCSFVLNGRQATTRVVLLR